METSHAILLRRYKLTESSLIVHWCTEDLGVVRTVAKGARRPKSTFAGKLDLFYTGEITFGRSRSGDLHVLSEVVIRDFRSGLQKDYDRLELASYFGSLVEMVVETDSPVPELFVLLDKALAYVESVGEVAEGALLRFEQRVAEHLGLLDEEGDGSEGETPAEAIARVYGRLPKGRP